MLFADFIERYDRFLQLMSLCEYMPDISLFYEEYEETEETHTVPSNTYIYNIREGDTALGAEDSAVSSYSSLSAYLVSPFTEYFDIYGFTEAADMSAELCNMYTDVMYVASAESISIHSGLGNFPSAEISEERYAQSETFSAFTPEISPGNCIYALPGHAADGHTEPLFELPGQGSDILHSYTGIYRAYTRDSGISRYFCGNTVYPEGYMMYATFGDDKYMSLAHNRLYAFFSDTAYGTYAEMQMYGDTLRSISSMEKSRASAYIGIKYDEYTDSPVYRTDITDTRSETALAHNRSSNEVYIDSPSIYAPAKLFDMLTACTQVQKSGDININVDFKAYAEVKNNYDVNKFADIFAKRLESELRSCAEGIHY